MLMASAILTDTIVSQSFMAHSPNNYHVPVSCDYIAGILDIHGQGMHCIGAACR